MKRRVRAWRTWLLVVTFAAAMAWVEAACVYYLRVLVDRVEPYQTNPLPMQGVLGPVELVREAATLLMLLTVGGIAGRTRATRLGYTAIAFGVWDICYYLILKIICDWPTSLFDWDILFLIPLPWWGPVVAPMSIALLMIVWGTLATRTTVRDSGRAAAARWWRVNAFGTALALYVFMADSIRAVSQGVAPNTVLPTVFNWPMFTLAVTLMAAPVVHLAWSILDGHTRARHDRPSYEDSDRDRASIRIH